MSIRRLRAACRPRAVRIRGDAGQVNAAGAVLNDDQGVEAPQQHGVHVDKVDRKNAAGLRGEELLPGRAGPPGPGSIAGRAGIHTVEAAIGGRA